MAVASSLAGNTSSSGQPPPHDKAVDAALVAVLAKVGDVKGSLSNFVGKMEQETLTWPSVLDSFSALAGHYSTLMKQLNNDKIPPLQNQILLPNQVSSDRDTELERSTEGRVPILHHEIVPNYMRTKLELDLEAKQRDLHIEASKTSPDFTDTLKKFNLLVDRATALVDDARENWEKQNKRLDTIQLTTQEETRRLVAAYLSGAGLGQMSPNRRMMLMGVKPTMQPQMGSHQIIHQPMARTISRVAPPLPPHPGVHPLHMGGPPLPPFQTSPYKR